MATVTTCPSCGQEHMCYQNEPENSEAERPVDEELVSNCCTAPFGYPGWPDNDICSKCGEHADTAINEEIINKKERKSEL